LDDALILGKPVLYSDCFKYILMKIAIIGSGPAGIFTSLQLKNLPGEVHLFEQNARVGVKLEKTGGGRMNVTNRVFSVDKFSSNQPNLLKRFFKNPWVKNRFQIFEEMGVEYEWEGDRAILKGQDAIAEVERLSERLENQKNLILQLGAEVISIEKKEEQYRVCFLRGDVQGEDLFDIVIISGGGMFRIGRPSENEGIYRLPHQLGHTITEVSPSLSSLVVKNNPLNKFSGIALRVELTDLSSGKKMCDDMLIAHHGFSGPLALDFSSILQGTKVGLNFLPDLKEEDFTVKFNALRQGKHSVRGLLRQHLPKRLADWHMVQADIKEEDAIADVSKDKLKQLRKTLYRLEIEGVTTLDYSACWTTRGGIDLSEVNVSTLESKLHKNLYFSGEILDINGLCGGYNISFAAISGKIVAEGIIKNFSN